MAREEPEPSRFGAGLVETLRIGVAEGDERYQFHIVRDIAPDPAAGEVFVTDSPSPTPIPRCVSAQCEPDCAR